MKTIGKYQVAGEIGRSAAGVTCRARDPFRNREYVLKVLSPLAALSAAAKDQLYRELDTAWQLSHRHIAKVQDVGELEALLYIATELLSGSALPGFLSAEIPTLADRVTLMAQIAEALACAHSHGIAHGNLKPSNIFITDTRNATVLDLGTGTWQALLLASGVRLNDLLPNYLAPEQILGEPFDARSDVFALGVLLYEIAGGQYPFQAAPGVVPREIVHSEPDPLRKWNPQIPEELEQTVVRAMKKDPRDRFQSADEIAASLYAIAQQIRLEPRAVRPVETVAVPEAPVQTEEQPMAPVAETVEKAADVPAPAPIADAAPAVPDFAPAVPDASPELSPAAAEVPAFQADPIASAPALAPDPAPSEAIPAAPALPAGPPLFIPPVFSSPASEGRGTTVSPLPPNPETAAGPTPSAKARPPKKKRSAMAFAVGAVMALSMVGVIVVRQNMAAPGSHESAVQPAQPTTSQPSQAPVSATEPAKPTPFQAAPAVPAVPAAPATPPTPAQPPADPQAEQILRTQVRPLWEAGDYAQAMRLVDDVLANSPANGEARAWKKKIRAAQEAEADIK